MTEKKKTLFGDILFGDINGDGKADIMTRTKVFQSNLLEQSRQEVYYSNGKNGFNKDEVVHGKLTPFHLKDYDIFDWTYWIPLGMDGTPEIIRGGFWDIEGTAYTKKDGVYGPIHYPLDSKFFLQDINGDGLPDFVELDKEGKVFVYKNINGKFSSDAEIAPETIEKRSKFLMSRVSDANKVYPILGVKAENLSLIRNTVNEQENRLMSSSKSSLGVITKYSYKALTDTAVCKVENKIPLTFPYNYFIEHIYALKNLETIYNNITLSSTSYKYTNPIIHRQGLGFRGFEKVTTKDNMRNLSTVQISDPTNFGIVKYIDSPTSFVSSEYTFSVAPNKVTQVLLSSKTTKDKLNDTSVTSSYEYDSYGNPTGETTDYGNGISTVTSGKLKNINTATTYLLGLPEEQTSVSIRDGESVTTKTKIYYDANNLPTYKASYYNNNQTSEESYVYDTDLNLQESKSRSYSASDWLVTAYKYDSYGRVTRTTDPLKFYEEYKYGKTGLLDSVVNYKGHVTTYKYDAWGRNTTTTHAGGTIESVNLAWATSPTGALIVTTATATGKPDTQSYVDALGREIRKGQKRFDGVYLYTDNKYDNWGRLEQTSLPFRGAAPTLWNSYQYDSYDRIKALNYASGKRDTYAYGKLQTRSDIDGVATIKTYDVSGQVISIEDAAGTITYKYRPDGQAKLITAPGGIETSFEYDSYGRQTKLIDPSAGTKVFGYDAAGNINQETDARGKVTKMTYDAYNRLTKKEVVGELTTSYGFNADGLLEREASTNKTSKTYLYDKFFRLETQRDSVVDNKWLQKKYVYLSGSLFSTTYSSQSGDITTENYKYAYGHQTEIKLNDVTSIWKLTAENNMGMPSSSTTGVLTRTYGYDNFGMPTSRVIKNGSTVIQDFGYNIDSKTGNLKWRKDNTRNKQEDFTYDKINRLTGFGNKTISYDTKGNITYFPNVGQLKYDAAKPYAMATIASCQTGDMVNLDNYRREQVVTYNGMMRPATISENGYTTAFIYNSDADRVKMLTQRNGTTDLERYYIGGQYEMDKTVVGTEERLYLGGDAYSAAAVYVRQNTGAWVVNYIGRDYLGSITHVMDATGVVKQELSYDPWGRLRNPVTQALLDINQRVTLLLGDRGYTGHEHLSNFGLINTNARLYDPVVGRFLSPDPYVQAPDMSQNFNRYSYALNNPLRFTDPNGEFFFAPLIILGGGFLMGYLGHGMSTGNWGFMALVSGWMGMITSGVTMGGSSVFMSVGQAFAHVGSDAGAMLLNNVVKPIEYTKGDFGFSLSPIAFITWGESFTPKFNYGASVSVKAGNFTLSGGAANKFLSYGLGFDNGTVGLGYGRTNYSDFPQTTGTVSARYKDFAVRVENDVIGDKNDRYRSNATEIGYKGYFVGTNVFTNAPKDEEGFDRFKAKYVSYEISDNGSKLFNNNHGTYLRGEKSSSPLYFGMKRGNQMTRFGFNDPLFGDFAQNGFHHPIGSPNFNQGNYGTNAYFQTGTYLPFMIY